MEAACVACADEVKSLGHLPVTPRGKPALAAFVESHSSQSTRRMGHPLCCLCRRGQERGRPVRNSARKSLHSRRSWNPTLAKCARGGAPLCCLCRRGQEPGPPARNSARKACTRGVGGIPLFAKYAKGGHPLRCLCRRGQERGRPARNFARKSLHSWRSWNPTLAKCAKDGASLVLLASAKSKTKVRRGLSGHSL